MKKVRHILGVLGIIIVFCSCNEKTDNLSKKEIEFIKDSVVYVLSEEASQKLDELIGNDTINILSLIINSDNNEYNFGFSFFENKVYRGEKEKYILKHSNRYLKTKNHTFNIFLFSDKCFSISPENKMNYIMDYSGGGITVNAKGELLEYYSERYRLK